MDTDRPHMETINRNTTGGFGPLKRRMNMTNLYMNVETGSVNTKDEWNYELEDGTIVNAVDRGEVVPVEWSEKDGYWVESNA